MSEILMIDVIDDEKMALKYSESKYYFTYQADSFRFCLLDS